MIGISPNCDPDQRLCQKRCDKLASNIGCKHVIAAKPGHDVPTAFGGRSRIRVVCAKAVAEADEAIQKANDPRFSAVLRWFSGIFASLAVVLITINLNKTSSFQDSITKLNLQNEMVMKMLAEQRTQTQMILANQTNVMVRLAVLENERRRTSQP